MTDESGPEEQIWGELLEAALQDASGPIRGAINSVLGDIDGESRELADLVGRGLEYVTNVIDAVLERLLAWAFTPERSQQNLERMERVGEAFEAVFEEIARRWLVPALLESRRHASKREEPSDDPLE